MSKYDKLFKKAELFEKLAVYGDRSSFLRSISQVTPTVGGTPEAEQYLKDLDSQKPSTQTLPNTTIVGNPPIGRNVQEMLNQLLAVQNSDMLPIPVDGELGPKTRDALQKFTKRYGKPATSAAVAQVFNEQKDQVAKRDPGAPLGPMGSGLGGIGNTQRTAPTGAGTEPKVPGPKA